MSKKNTNAGAKEATCDKCGTKAHSIPGTQHRRCSGQMDQAPRAKHENIAGNLRGRWG